jgi:hypothetical protein
LLPAKKFIFSFTPIYFFGSFAKLFIKTNYPASFTFKNLYLLQKFYFIANFGAKILT